MSGLNNNISKTKQTALLLLISALNLLVSSGLALLQGRIILTTVGSDYNGLNSIVTQFLLIVTLAEGGFTTASLVALFKPAEKNDIFEMNNILGETANKFKRIGGISIITGIILSLVYSALIKSQIPYLEIYGILVMAILSNVLGLMYLTKYRLLFQVTQREHIYVAIILVFNTLSSLISTIVIACSESVFIAKVIQFIFVVISIVVMRRVVVTKYKMIDFKHWDNKRRIIGTKDVMITKIVGVMHSSSTTVFLSLFSSTKMTSVYAVYHSVVNLISSVISMCIMAPQNALGKTIHEGDISKTKKVFHEFELLVIMVLTILLVPTWILIVPFVNIYTAGVTDIEYSNTILAALLIVETYIRLVHIPSGLMVFLSGRFNVAKKIQTAGLVVLVFCNCVFGAVFGFYGIIISSLICDVLLAGLEIGSTHKDVSSQKLFLSVLLVNSFLFFLLVVLLDPIIVIIGNSLVMFVVCGVVLLIITVTAVVSVNYVMFREMVRSSINRIFSILRVTRKE